ncbi:MAG: GspH/FimT family pseudopilin, partial [Methylococcaceae bacterium]
MIELMVTIAIMAIMVAIGFPSFQAMIASSRLTSTTNAMVSTLQMARMEALKQHQTVIIKPKDDVTDGWANGWSVFVDLNGNTKQDAL